VTALPPAFAPPHAKAKVRPAGAGARLKKVFQPTTSARFNFNEKGARQGKLVTQTCRSVASEGYCAKWADVARNWSNSKLLEPYLTRMVMAAFAVPTSHRQEAMRAIATARPAFAVAFRF
jgi:hypothetical protein